MVPAAVVKLLEAGAPSEPGEVLVCVAELRDCFIEGRVGNTTFAASLQLDGSGDIARCLCFRCPLVPAPPPRVDREPAPALPLLERYFRQLGTGAFAEASACFSRDCLYSHPPYSADEPRVEFHGRERLQAGWAARRGVKPVEIAILRSVQNGSHAFIEGVANGGSFVSSVALDGDGLICRYVAFHTRSRAPRHPEGL